MSVVAASEEDVKAGEHMLLADVRFRLGLPDAAVSPQEKEELKANLIAGITKYGKFPRLHPPFTVASLLIQMRANPISRFPPLPQR